MRGCLLLMAIVCLVEISPSCGLIAQPPVLPLPSELPPPSALPQTNGVTFAELAGLAAASHPDLRIARAAVIAAQGRFIQAGLYFNPSIGYYGTDLNSKASAAGKQGLNIIQQIVTGNKLGLAQAAARHGIATADWNAITQYFNVASRLRSAYFDALAAQREVEVNENLVRLAEQGFQSAEKLEKAGTGARPDVLRARVDLELFRNRLAVAQRRAEATWRLLAVGQPEMERRPLAGRLEEEPGNYNFDDLQRHILANSAEVRATWSAVAEAEGLLKRAQAEVCPNLNMQVVPDYQFDDRRPGMFMQVTAPIPVFNRNQGNILAAKAEVGRTYQVVRQTELLLVQRLTLAFQRYQAGREQARRFTRRVLPDAAEAIKLIQLGYERGDARYDYTTVLQAQNALAQAQLSYVGVLNDLQRSVSEIEGLLQRDSVLGPVQLPSECR